MSVSILGLLGRRKFAVSFYTFLLCFAFFLGGLDLTARADHFYFLLFRDVVLEIPILDLEVCAYY